MKEKKKVYLMLEGVVIDTSKEKNCLLAPFVDGAETGIKLLKVHYDVILRSNYHSMLEKNIKDMIAETLGVQIKYIGEECSYDDVVLVKPDIVIEYGENPVVKLKFENVVLVKPDIVIEYGKNPVAKLKFENGVDWFSLLDCLIESKRVVESIFPEDSMVQDLSGKEVITILKDIVINDKVHKTFSSTSVEGILRNMSTTKILDICKDWNDKKNV